ncbi:NADP-dependent oxidoreductase domain-containing protein [Suillus discolor]|uniref:NADP-dependent oxidoreductase domain-containing protein n=1 Tax=Suillus discolor TaxID=1912936 RepID=A0A9P7F821_9AGAM|nr:NADP-dependent oxidoreductase domain-containing protein [Suillus discolor]KAG2108195.1 NADP-dependent oxidoreductase domain-containing protein [Suillus discolor]
MHCGLRGAMVPADDRGAEGVVLGQSGLRVSVPILGAMSFGSAKWAPWVLDEEPSIEIMKAAWDLGINTIDTGNIYSHSELERLIAKFIKKYSIPCSQIIIATKCYGLVANDPSILLFFMPEYINQSGLSRAAIFNAVDVSLACLETPYIDLLQIHRFDPSFAMLNDMAARNSWTMFISMQDEYSLLYREEECEMLTYYKYNSIGVIPYAPLYYGLLARPIGTESMRHNSTKGSVLERKVISADLRNTDLTIINRVEELSKKKNCKMSQIALAWVASKVSSPIVGISSIQSCRSTWRSHVLMTPLQV